MSKAPAASKGTYTAAQQAQLAWLKKNYPFPKETQAQFKAWEKAHPFPTRHQEHAAHLKHLAHLKATGRTAAAAKARSLSRGDVGCCAAEAVTAWLRLEGVPFSDADMLDLFWRAGGHPDRGVPLGEILAASGLLFTPAGLDTPGDLILGLDLPAPHAVLATADGWWSWGVLWCPCEFPDAVIEEAWAVTLPGGEEPA